MLILGLHFAPRFVGRGGGVPTSRRAHLGSESTASGVSLLIATLAASPAEDNQNEWQHRAHHGPDKAPLCHWHPPIGRLTARERSVCTRSTNSCYGFPIFLTDFPAPRKMRIIKRDVLCLHFRLVFFARGRKEAMGRLFF